MRCLLRFVMSRWKFDRYLGSRSQLGRARFDSFSWPETEPPNSQAAAAAPAAMASPVAILVRNGCKAARV
jgi:hypothetical protein